MTTEDVIRRARLVEIESEPAFKPLVKVSAGAPPLVKQTPKMPATQLLGDRAKVTDLLARAAREAAAGKPAAIPERNTGRPDETVLPVPSRINRRVEIMISGNLSRIAVARTAMTYLQTQLFQQLGGDHLELRMTAFLDGCRHTTAWSRSPIDAGSSTTYWHCFQGQTLFAEAFSFTNCEADPVDVIVMFGNRFDDNLATTLRWADTLRERGTRIYAFHTGRRLGSRDAYQKIAERSGGAFIHLTNHRAFVPVMGVIADYLVRPVEALHTQPAPRDRDVKALLDRLKLQSPPPVLRLTWRPS